MPTDRPVQPHQGASSEAQGAFSLVLHTHLPYCRMAGRWPHGEEWIHEALAETYIPLLNALYDLYKVGILPRVTLNLTPVLVEQLTDADVLAHFGEFVDQETRGASQDRARFAKAGDERLATLAHFYEGLYRNVSRSFAERFGGDVVGAFRHLQDAGVIEIITCPATHGYLPLLSRDSSIYGQLRTAVASYERHFGRAPRGVWLSECAYRPAQRDAQGILRPGLEEFLAGLGLTCFFAETRAIVGTRATAAEAEVLLGPYGAAERRYRATVGKGTVSSGTTFSPYWVAGPDGRTTIPPVAVVGRNERTGMQVWSASWGYPGDPAYREFHRKDPISGLQYWRVTGPDVALGQKDIYDPAAAAERVAAHASHYASLVADLLATHARETGDRGLIASNYDTELFGHWWFEGVEWIKQMLAALATDPTVELISPCDYVAAHPPRESIALAEGSWGAGGTHWTWDNDETHHLWPPIYAAERRMEALVARFPDADGPARLALNQAARELLLLQSSDWPFLVTTRQAKEYALQRFRSHQDRFTVLAALLELDSMARAEATAREYYDLDKVFPDIDYRWFAARQGRAR